MKGSRPRSSRRPASPLPPAAAGRAARWVPTLLVALLAVAFIVRIGAQALRARFNTDECFHAYVAEWIAAHHRLPEVLPEFYSGFDYCYPPLLHILGAI